MTGRGAPGTREFGWMRDQLYVLFRDALRGAAGSGDPAWQPAVDVIETKDEVEIRIDLVGVSEEEVTVDCKDERIVVRAAWLEESTQRDLRREETERSRREFERSFRVPEGLDCASLQSSYSHGLLTMTLRKA